MGFRIFTERKWWPLPASKIPKNAAFGPITTHIFKEFSSFFTPSISVKKGVKMKLPTKFKFTDLRLVRLPSYDKTRTFSDLVLNNLKLVVTPSGTKTFYVRFKTNGQPINHKLGNADALSVDEARSRAVAYINFRTAQQVRCQSGLTVNDVFNLYRDNELSARRTIAGRTHALEISYNLHLKPIIGKMNIEQLTKKIARTVFIELENRGYSVHNRCLSAIKSAFNYVIEFEEGLPVTANPFMGIKKLTEVQRNRYLTKSEAKRLLLALDTEKNQDVADIYRVALFTGARLSNVKTMRWYEIDFSSGQWLIPATNTKTSKVYQIPLHSFVINLLKQRREQASDSPFVFASERSRYGYITGGDPVWKSAITRAGLYHDNPNIRPRPHDLRRTFATWQLQSGADISVVSKALCHTSLKNTMIYAQTNLDQVRNSIESAFEFME
ncbi:MAG: site-specific integrase [Pseudoalteromonas sp.]|uniref:tyrosine-type recombinase/integrase n=1 Tax=Pseudoalteromonas sp. TaxID=53249 RepID=UPI001DCBCD6C|nr:site-specific integrase [Pseudoalteromonas sp.]NRA80865.1 site-specific integrase [Pseudoalteromonas sp.]